jgi:nucleoside-diphosphate-sugar epimerase
MAVAVAGSGEIIRAPWPDEYRAIETGDYQSDTTLALNELGWRPFTDIREGIERTVAFYKKDRGPGARG